MADFLRGTDVLIMDAQYDCKEYEQHRGWGHGCTEDVVALAMKAQVKRLVLFHHDPEHEDDKIEAMEAEARKFVESQKSDMQVEAAREGAVITL